MARKKNFGTFTVSLANVPRKRTGIEERPTIPCKKVFLSKKDKQAGRAARKNDIRRARNEYC